MIVIVPPFSDIHTVRPESEDGAEGRFLQGEQLVREFDAVYRQAIADLIERPTRYVGFYDGIPVTAPAETPADDQTIEDYDEWLEDLRNDQKSADPPSDKGDPDTKLPLGEFWFDYENHDTPQYTWEQISAMSDADLRVLGDSVVIAAYSDAPSRGPDAHFFPFPSFQFTLDGPGKSTTADAICAGVHYTGANGLDIGAGGTILRRECVPGAALRSATGSSSCRAIISPTGWHWPPDER